MPRPEKGSEEAKAWAAKMKAARDGKKSATPAPQKAEPKVSKRPAKGSQEAKDWAAKMRAARDGKKSMKGGMMSEEDKKEKKLLDKFEVETYDYDNNDFIPRSQIANALENKSIKGKDKFNNVMKKASDYMKLVDKSILGEDNNSSSGRGMKIYGGFLQPDELPASMRFVADPMDMINTKEETIDGGNLKTMIEAFRRKWSGK